MRAERPGRAVWVRVGVEEELDDADEADAVSEVDSDVFNLVVEFLEGVLLGFDGVAEMDEGADDIS